MQTRMQLFVTLHLCQHELYFGANRLAVLCLQVCFNQNWWGHHYLSCAFSLVYFLLLYLVYF